MRRWSRVVVASGIAAAVGCSSGYSSTPEGAEGGPCYGNGTCNPGLTCGSNLCVAIDAGNAADASTKSDAADALDGSTNANDASGADGDLASVDGSMSCALMDGTYSVTVTAMDAADYDGGLCMGEVGQFTWPHDGGFGAGCVASNNGCTVTCDTTTSPQSGLTTKTHFVFAVSANGMGYTGNGTQTTTSNGNGAIFQDCIYVETGKL
jgi:hypothetical protein